MQELIKTTGPTNWLCIFHKMNLCKIFLTKSMSGYGNNYPNNAKM